MWSALITAGGWALFGCLVIFWAWWVDREREQFSNEESSHLE